MDAVSAHDVLDELRRRVPSQSDTDLAVRSPVITHEALREWFVTDDRFRARRATAARLRARRDVHSFTPVADIPGIDAAIDRALRGERVLDGRPGAA